MDLGLLGLARLGWIDDKLLLLAIYTVLFLLGSVGDEQRTLWFGVITDLILRSIYCKETRLELGLGSLRTIGRVEVIDAGFHAKA